MSKNVFNKLIIQQASSDQPSSPSHPRMTITSTPDSGRRRLPHICYLTEFEAVINQPSDPPVSNSYTTGLSSCPHIRMEKLWRCIY